MSIPKLGGERPGQDRPPGERPLGERPFSDKPGDKTRDKIRNVLGKASVNTGLGKLPPQAVDLEEAVLGALMLEKDALTTVIEILQVESFYREPHQKIYEAILTLFDNSEPVDILTVTNQLRKKRHPGVCRRPLLRKRPHPARKLGGQRGVSRPHRF